MEVLPWVKPFFAVFISFVLAGRAYRAKSLSLSGAISTFVIIAIHFCAGLRFGVILLSFLFTSSKLMKLVEDKRRRDDPEFTDGVPRNWIQVLSNSGIATVLVIIVWILTDGQDKCLNSNDSALITSLIGGIIGQYSCSVGNTWSFALVVLSEDEPFLIITFQPVRRGTNGGVTLTGINAASATSGIGLLFILVGFFTTKCGFDIGRKQLMVLSVFSVGGFLGNLVHSLLAATLQFSGFCTVSNKVVGKPGPTVEKISGLNILDSNMVKFVSILLTSILTSFLCLILFY